MKMNELIDQFDAEVTALEADLDAVEANFEAAQEKAGLAKSVNRRLETLVEDAKNLLGEGKSTFVEFESASASLSASVQTFANVANPAAAISAEVKDHAGKVAQAIDVAELVPGVNVDKAQDAMKRFADVQERFASLAGRKTTRGASPASGLRALGVDIGFHCGCGFERHSPKGDWTSIRHQAKTHGAECATANPGLGDSLTNDLDRVRHELIEQRNSPVTSGGLRFVIEQPTAPVLATAETAAAV
jgi:phage-related protein